MVGTVKILNAVVDGGERVLRRWQYCRLQSVRPKSQQLELQVDLELASLRMCNAIKVGDMAKTGDALQAGDVVEAGKVVEASNGAGWRLMW